MSNHALETASAFEGAASRTFAALFSGSSSIREALATAWANYQDWAEARRASRHLRHLDDRLLRDIGVSRSEINRIVYGPRAMEHVDDDVA